MAERERMEEWAAMLTRKDGQIAELEAQLTTARARVAELEKWHHDAMCAVNAAGLIEAVPEAITELARCAEQAEAREGALREAAENLAGEVRGVLGIAEEEMRAALGNTNVNCLQRRMEQVRALIVPTADRRAS